MDTGAVKLPTCSASLETSTRRCTGDHDCSHLPTAAARAELPASTRLRASEKRHAPPPRMRAALSNGKTLETRISESQSLRTQRAPIVHGLSRACSATQGVH